jgi:hypothetical protein
MERRLVGIAPAAERTRRRRLFDALEEAFPVRFEARAPDALGGLDAAVLIAAGEHVERSATHGMPTVVATADERWGTHSDAPPDAGYALAATGELDARLRGRFLRDPAAWYAAPVRVEPGDRVLARFGRAPVWVRREGAGGRRDVVALVPDELAPGEALRERLRGGGRSLALLPLIELLRAVTEDLAFRPPELRACFVIDDPNLHWPSYGHVRFAELGRHAADEDYHAAMAMVALDGWVAHPAAARVFRERADRLSLVVHGNDHVIEELGRPWSEARFHAAFAQALRRCAAFERRSGVRVDRVIAPPHGACSERAAAAMFALGFEALCVSRPFPWLAVPPLSWLTRPPRSSPLAGWQPATLVSGGLPVVLRTPLWMSDDELVLRAYLDQPLVLYGHHGDVREGLDVLAERARFINGLGGVRWGPLAAIARSNVETRREGPELRVRPLGRLVHVDVPAGVERLRVLLPPIHGGAGRVVIRRPGRPLVLRGGDPLPVGAGRYEIELLAPTRLDAAAIPPPPWRPWPVARRLAGESKDRLAALRRPPSARRAPA